MRIGILTFHRSINNGAVMQCFSLSKLLRQAFPHSTIEVIDYHMPKVEDFYKVSFKKYFGKPSFTVAVKRLILLAVDPSLLNRLKDRRDAFEDSFLVLPLSSKRMFSDDAQELFEYIQDNYDVVVAGSDAIWNYDMRGFPNPYFLSEKITIPKLTYAASCYGMSYEKIIPEEKMHIKRILDSYQFLGVRDEESAGFVKSMGGIVDPIHTCDPTVFLDVNDLPVDLNDLNKKLEKQGFSQERMSIAVMGTEALCKMVRKMYGGEYQIVALYNYCRNADVNLHNLTPFEWAYMFRMFQCTFTTFFHGTLVSLRNGTPVICVAVESEYSKKHMTKVEDFLRRINMEDCYFHTDYVARNVSEMKSKADELMRSNLKESICRKMDEEALTVQPFIDNLRNICSELG